MALVLKDRVQEVSTTSGTGTLTLTGAVSGFQTFSTAIGNGNTTYYTIFDSTAYVWEVGIGTVGAGTLARTTVLANSSGTTSAINLAGNSVNVFCTYPAEKSINYDADGVATIGSALGYTDTGIIASFASTVAGYNQVILQNKSTATNASTNFNVSNDAGTAGSNYAELGINSSTFTGSGSFNIAGASYVASASTDLTLGTYGAYSIHFVTNSSTTDAMTIFNNGGISLGGFSNPGIGNMAASKFVPGYTSVTAAAGTTTLTASSDYYQNLVGTTTQTFKLPDATGLLEGTTFIFDNDSTGTLTVVDNASGPIETVPSGAASFVYLADNATVAGTWRRHAFLPASYDFNATTANFGNATITNAVWNGTTIASGYGGTGLTTFTGANNALYSTNATTLVAGTLPIAAGGTAKTTFTANGVVYGDGTNPLGVTAAGTTGQVLVGNTGGAPSWATVSSSLVSSFQTSLSGLTPSTATTGAVTLAGTLGVTSGGTGTATSFTTGSVVFAGASGVYSQNNANFFWDDSNNRLGIGTASPGAKLDITSAAAFSFRLRGPSNVYQDITDGTGTLRLQLLSNSPFITSIGSYSVSFGTNNTERMRITSNGGISFGSSGTAYGTSGQVLTSAGDAPPTWTTPTTGTVTSVSFTGGIISVATATTTPAFTIAGTSGGIPYFSSASTWTSSGVLAANALVIGGGAGVAPSTTTTGTGVLTALGIAANGSGGFVTDTGTVTLTNKTISADNNTLSGIAASSFVLSNASGNIDGAAAQKAIPSGTVVGTTDTQTLTNKRITPRVSTTTSSATPTINTDDVDMYGLTAQTANITSFTTNLSGTPTDGQKLWIYIVGTAARTITWGASFEASTVALPTTTVSTNRLDVGFVWNAATSKWRCVAVA